MRRTGSGQTPSRGVWRLREMLAVGQIALMLALLYGMMLLLLNSKRLDEDPGFEHSGLLVGRLEPLHSPQAEGLPRQRAMMAAWMKDVASMPGVEAMGLAPAYDSPVDSVEVIVRTQGAPNALADAMQDHLERIAPELRFVQLVLEQPSTADTRKGWFGFDALPLILALVPTLIATVSLYAMLTSRVTVRFRELGVLQALEADRKDIIEQVLGEGAKRMWVGFAIGSPLAFLLGWILSLLSYGMRWFDPLLLLAVLGWLSMICLSANLMPLYRVLKAKAIDTLRA